MTDNNGLHDYTYDPLYQIIEATHPTVHRPTEGFEYDAVGNRLGGSRVHNELNQLTEDDSCRYAYDADGNMIFKVSKSTNDSTKYTWNIENRLVKVEMPNGTVVEYVYGPLGRRLAKVVNGQRKEYRYDGEDLIIEMDENDSIVASYTFGPGIDQPLAMHRNQKDYYYLTDGLGSVTAITDENCTVLQEYLCSVFGEVLVQSADSVENPFTFTAREEEETGLMYYRNRFYDPEIGRFISEDPISFNGCDYNLYRYVYDNPTNYTDPEGLWVAQAIGTGLGAGFAAWQNYADFRSGRISGWTYAARIGFGGLTGLASSFGVGLWGNIIRGSLTAGANEIFRQSTDPCSDNFDYEKIGFSAFTGAVTSSISFGSARIGSRFGYYTGGTPSIQNPVRLNFHTLEIPSGTVGNVIGTYVGSQYGQ